MVVEQTCPVCRCGSPEVFLERSWTPVHQNLLYLSSEKARNCTRGEIELAFCRNCGFITNVAFDAKLLTYGENYDNTQTHSPAFAQYVQHLADYLIKKYGLNGKKIVEVGCGKGHFLRVLCAGGRNQGIGFDPSYVGPEQAPGDPVRFIRQFYDEAASSLCERADFLCCRHVIEHVQAPVSMLMSVRRAVSAEAATPVFFETPSVRWILRQGAFWDIFYEHCSYFDSGSLSFAFSQAGFKVVSIRPAFGDQYLWIEATPAGPGKAENPADASCIAQMALEVSAFAKSYSAQMEKYQALMEKRSQNGACAVWGAGAKGVTFLNVLDPDAQRVSFVIDINPKKQGKYIPGTGHPIVPPEALETGGPVTILNMNPNYLEENRRMLQEMSIQATLLSL